jgi:hypothetical protein
MRIRKFNVEWQPRTGSASIPEASAPLYSPNPTLTKIVSWFTGVLYLFLDPDRFDLVGGRRLLFSYSRIQLRILGSLQLETLELSSVGFLLGLFARLPAYFP